MADVAAVVCAVIALVILPVALYYQHKDGKSG